MSIKFKRNMNAIDRGFRIFVGLTLLTLGPVTEFITTDKLSGIILGVMGTTALISALFSYCILYDVTGFNTIKTSDKPEETQ